MKDTLSSRIHPDGRLCIRKTQLREAFGEVPGAVRWHLDPELSTDPFITPLFDPPKTFAPGRDSGIYAVSSAGKVLIPLQAFVPSCTEVRVSLSNNRITIHIKKDTQMAKSTNDGGHVRDPKGRTAHAYMVAWRRAYLEGLPPGHNIIARRFDDSTTKPIHQCIQFFVVKCEQGDNGRLRQQYYDEDGKLISQTGKGSFKSSRGSKALALLEKVTGYTIALQHPTRRNPSFETLKTLIAQTGTPSPQPQTMAPIPTPSQVRKRASLKQPLPRPADNRQAFFIRGQIQKRLTEAPVTDEFRLGPFSGLTDAAVDILRSNIASSLWEPVRDGDYVCVRPLE